MTDLNQLVEQLSDLSVIQAAELAQLLEKKWGVSAASPVAMAMPAAASAGSAAVEKTEFDVLLKGSGANKLNVIKTMRELIPTLGLKEAKDFVEASDKSPQKVKEGVTKEEAKVAKEKLEAAGASVSVE